MTFLDAEAVEAWTVSVPQSQDQLLRYEQLLSGDELRRADAFRFVRLRNTFVASRGVLRRLLERYTSVPAEDIELSYTKLGKPFLAGSSLSFNLSHSGQSLCYLFAEGTEVGIDVEQVRPVDDLLGLAKRFFAPPEVDTVEQAMPQLRTQLFFKIWTLKEAFIKGTGEGLSCPLDSFAVEMKPEQQDSAQHDWFLRSFSPADGYAGALACNGPLKRLRWNTIDDSHSPELQLGVDPPATFCATVRMMQGQNQSRRMDLRNE